MLLLTIASCFLLLGGDIQLNPGPVRHPCTVCSNPVAANHRAVQCDICQGWTHIKCGQISVDQYKEMTFQSFWWPCPSCDNFNFSESFFEDSIVSENSFSELSDLSIKEANDSSEMNTHTGENTDNQPLHDQVPSPVNNTGVNQQLRGTNRQRSPHKLKCININVQGIKGLDKRAEFHAFVNHEKPDIIIGTESHLDESYTNSDIFPEGYRTNVVRKDRNSHGGGVFIAAKDLFNVTPVELNNKDCPLILAKIQAPGEKPLLVGLFYRATDNKRDELNSLIDNLDGLIKDNTLPELIIAGDFNLPSIIWGTDNTHVATRPQYGQELNEMCVWMADTLD